MRFSLSPKFGKSAGNVLIVALLASVATGCSSDVTRFGGLFSSSGQDQMTTNSIPRMSGLQADPVPRADMQGGAMQPNYANSGQAMNQPYPAQQPAYGSSARMASAPVSVQRSELARHPGGLAGPRNGRSLSPSRSQHRPAHEVAPVLVPPNGTDAIVTGTTPKVSGWSSDQRAFSDHASRRKHRDTCQALRRSGEGNTARQRPEDGRCRQARPGRS
jgi:hypothetical protein